MSVLQFAGRVRRRSVHVVGASLLATLLSSGCASSSSSGGGLAEKTLDLFGLQTKPTVPDVSAADVLSRTRTAQKVTLRIHAGETLNTDASGQSLSLVARIYKLKDAGPLLQAPYETLQQTPAGRASSIDGVLEMREIVLTPGQKYEVVETLPPDATHLAVVALFRAPDDRRWRFAFDARAAVKTGITMGAHGCALSVSEGQPVNAPAETLRLAGVHCR